MSAHGGSGGKFKVTIKKYRATGVWKWDVPDAKPGAGAASSHAGHATMMLDEAEDCGICRQAFDATCPDCLLPGEDCPPVRGNCSHMYHMHCIVKWISNAQSEQAQQCPMCRAPWNF